MYMANTEKESRPGETHPHSPIEVEEYETGTGHDQQEGKPALWLPSFLIDNIAVLILFVASVACLVGLARQLVLLWEVTQQGRILERSVWDTI